MQTIHLPLWSRRFRLRSALVTTFATGRQGMAEQLSPRMLVHIPTRENCIDEYFPGLDSEQDPQVANTNLSFWSPVHKMIGSFNGVLLRIAQRFLDALPCVGVQALQVACRLLTELELAGRLTQRVAPSFQTRRGRFDRDPR